MDNKPNKRMFILYSDPRIIYGIWERARDVLFLHREVKRLTILHKLVQYDMLLEMRDKLQKEEPLDNRIDEIESEVFEKLQTTIKKRDKLRRNYKISKAIGRIAEHGIRQKYDVKTDTDVKYTPYGYYQWRVYIQKEFTAFALDEPISPIAPSFDDTETIVFEKWRYGRGVDWILGFGERTNTLYIQERD